MYQEQAIGPPASKVPVGFRFQPTDRELVAVFLRNKITGDVPFPPSLIYLCDLYGTEEPWEIWDRFSPLYNEMFARPANYDYEDDEAGMNRDLYFFTNVKKRKLCHSRVERGIGTGTWHGQDAGKPIKIRGKRVGLMKRFTYRNLNSEHDGQWLMLEYSILDETTRVLCRLRKKASAGKDENSPASSSSISEDPSDPAAEALPCAGEGLGPTVVENRPVLRDSSTEQQLSEFLSDDGGAKGKTKPIDLELRLTLLPVDHDRVKDEEQLPQ